MLDLFTMIFVTVSMSVLDARIFYDKSCLHKIISRSRRWKRGAQKDFSRQA